MLKKLFFLIVIFFNSSSYADFNSAIKYIEEKNYDKAIELLIPLATKDNLEALFYLGLSYYEKENYSEALIWFEECAEEGDVYCQNNLGHMYDSGLGEEDKIKALYWFSKASMQDILPHPITSLANMYIEGEVVKQSYSKAFQLYEKAAARDFDRAIYALGLMYEKGEGTAHNYKKAKELYLKAFHLGHEIALFR